MRCRKDCIPQRRISSRLRITVYVPLAQIWHSARGRSTVSSLLHVMQIMESWWGRRARLPGSPKFAYCTNPANLVLVSSVKMMCQYPKFWNRLAVKLYPLASQVCRESNGSAHRAVNLWRLRLINDGLLVVKYSNQEKARRARANGAGGRPSTGRIQDASQAWQAA